MEVTVDTSVLMAVILNEPSKGRLLRATRGAELVSPPVLPWEIGNALTSLLKRRQIDGLQARAALSAFQPIPVRLAEVDIESAVEMAREHDMYAYDAYFLECARRYRTRFLSIDRVQCQIASSLGIEVIEVGS